MVLAVGPLFSLDASGKFANTLIYGKNKAGNWVRPPLYRKKGVSLAQQEQRDMFSVAKVGWSLMSKEERQLWMAAVVEDHLDSGRDGYRFKRSGQCLWMHEVLASKAIEWDDCPFPPLLPRQDALYAMVNWDSIKSDIEAYTELSFCENPRVWFFEKLGFYISSLHPNDGERCKQIPSWRGGGVAFLYSYFFGLSTDDKIRFEIQNQVFILLNQHFWWYSINMTSAWVIAEEIADDLIAGGWTPPYTYDGKTLSEIVRYATCEHY